MPYNKTGRRPLNGGPMVRLSFRIGDRAENIQVQRSFLYTSDYLLPFLATWPGPGEQTIGALEFEFRSVFNIYGRWLSLRKIYTNAELALKHGHADSRTPVVIMRENGFDLVASWLLGDYLQDVRFKDMVVSEIIKRLKETTDGDRAAFLDCLTPNLVHDVYANTTTESPIRRLLVDAVIKFGTAATILHYFNFDRSYPREFVKSIMVIVFSDRDKSKAPKLLTPAPDTLPVNAKAKNRVVTWGGVSTVKNTTPKVTATSVLETTPETIKEVKQASFSDTDPLSNECAYHEHVRLNWPCSKLKPWG